MFHTNDLSTPIRVPSSAAPGMVHRSSAGPAEARGESQQGRDRVAINDNASGSWHCPWLPRELLLRILALLTPNDVALSGRLACKDAAQHFQGSHYCTAFLGKPLHSLVSAVGTAQSTSEASLSLPPTPIPAATNTATVHSTEPWIETSTKEALRQLTFRQKLLLPSKAAASGCETSLELAWQLLQPHVFPEVLQTKHYLDLLQQGRSSGDPAPDVGSVAVASGLAYMLPSLAQRCPGLLDPARTLQAAAKHCDLAGLQAAWQSVGERLRNGCEGESPERLQGFWRRMLAAAAGSGTPDAIAKMEWVLGMCGDASDPSTLAQAYGAAAASGDLARVRWLRERGVSWGTPGVLEAVVEHADLGFIQRMEAEGGYLPPAHDEGWSKDSVVSAAAAAPRDSAAKLRWLEGRGAALGVQDALLRAAERGDLEVVQLLVGHLRARHGAAAALPPDGALSLAIESGSVPTATFLRQAGYGFDPSAFASASSRGHLPLIRWLAEAGCPVDWEWICHAVCMWPCDSAADGEGLLEAVRVMAEVAPPVGDVSKLWSTALHAGHPWAVLKGLQQYRYAGDIPAEDVVFAVRAGCEATLRALVATDAYKKDEDMVSLFWYAYAARNGDCGTLACLRRLGLRLGEEAEDIVGLAVSLGAPLPALRWLAENGARLDRSELADALSGLEAAYRSSRDDERRAVEAWLRGGGATGSWSGAMHGELRTILVLLAASFVVLGLAVSCFGLYQWWLDVGA